MCYRCLSMCPNNLLTFVTVNSISPYFPNVANVFHCFRSWHTHSGVNYTWLGKHDKWPVTLMFFWAFLLKHPDHLIISKRTGCYAGCLRHGYQRSRMRLKRRALPTPHICECVKRSEVVHNHPFSTIKNTSRGYTANTDVYGPNTHISDWCYHIYIPQDIQPSAVSQ